MYNSLYKTVLHYFSDILTTNAQLLHNIYCILQSKNILILKVFSLKKNVEKKIVLWC